MMMMVMMMIMMMSSNAGQFLFYLSAENENGCWFNEDENRTLGDHRYCGGCGRSGGG